ncbi:MAG TPA: hypothetical protein VF590_18610 [Isosphaeraceae bacterium]
MLAARGDSASAREALAALCAAYWYPIYAFVRCMGSQHPDAEDLVQGFFTELLGRPEQMLEKVAPSRGSFRTFLRTCCRNYVRNQHEYATAKKRTGPRPPISIDTAWAEDRYRHEPAHNLTPERLYDRKWALEVLSRALTTVEGAWAPANKAGLFARLKPILVGGGDALPYEVIAAEVGLAEGTVKNKAVELRRRYGEVLRAEVAHTVGDDDDDEAVGDEIRALFAALSG